MRHRSRYLAALTLGLFLATAAEAIPMPLPSPVFVELQPDPAVTIGRVIDFSFNLNEEFIALFPLVGGAPLDSAGLASSDLGPSVPSATALLPFDEPLAASHGPFPFTIADADEDTPHPRLQTPAPGPLFLFGAAGAGFGLAYALGRPRGQRVAYLLERVAPSLVSRWCRMPERLEPRPRATGIRVGLVRWLIFVMRRLRRR